MNRILGIVILAFFALSCSSNLDFNQVLLEPKPIIVANLASFDVEQNEIVKEVGVEQILSGDLMDFNIFKENYLNNSLMRMDFYFEIDNTINRDFTFNLNFFDENNSNLYTIPFDVPAFTGVEKLVTKTEVFQNTNLELIKKTAKVTFVITMKPNPLLNSARTGRLKLRSSATIYFNAK